MMYCATEGPKPQCYTSRYWDLWNCQNKTFSSLSRLSQGFWHDRKLTGIPLATMQRPSARTVNSPKPAGSTFCEVSVYSATPGLQRGGTTTQAPSMWLSFSQWVENTGSRVKALCAAFLGSWLASNAWFSYCSVTLLLPGWDRWVLAGWPSSKVSAHCTAGRKCFPKSPP